MKVLILGAAGMLGRKLSDRLVADGTLGGEKISKVYCFDAVDTETHSYNNESTVPVSFTCGDISEAETVKKLIANEPDIIFHLAAVVSAEAEGNLEKGYRINVIGTQNLFDAIVAKPRYFPRVVYTSSVAVFGGPYPNEIDDNFCLTPLSSYGTQKAVGELLLADFTRRGYFDGVGIRLPTLLVRPGKPNLAASSFLSNIIREPLAGKRAVLPVPRDGLYSIASPRSGVSYLIRAAEIDGAEIGPRRNITMPSLTVSIEDMIKSLEKFGGKEVVELIDAIHDEKIAEIVHTWPSRFKTTRAESLGFKTDESIDAIIQGYIDDEMGGSVLCRT